MSTQNEPSLGQEEEFLGESPAGDATPDEYVSNDQQTETSDETGTVYEPTGEPVATPHDEAIESEDEEPA